MELLGYPGIGKELQYRNYYEVCYKYRRLTALMDRSAAQVLCNTVRILKHCTVGTIVLDMIKTIAMFCDLLR